ncbi:MAG: DUF4388 domain-containing protein [Bryobacterales bacterium]|nr:DUF4388 domain-containing protein [Bryobacterales bacterium]
MLVCDTHEGIAPQPQLTTHTILVVVRDAQVASAIRQSTQFATPALRVLTAETGGEAHAILQQEPVSLAVTILPVRTGFEFVAIASERFPHMPHIAASCSQAGELDEVAIRLMDLLEHQEEEVRIERLAVSMVETLILQRVSSGFLRAISLLDTIRLLEAENCTSTLTLRQPKTNTQAVLFFRSGRLLDAHTSHSGGMAAAREVLEWRDIHISISSGCRDIEPRINKPVSQLLTEWVAQAAQIALPDEAVEPLPAVVDAIEPMPAVVEAVEELPVAVEAAALPTEQAAKQPTLRDLLASQEIEFDAAPEPEVQNPPVADSRPQPQNPLAQRLRETVDFDLGALRQFTVTEPTAPEAAAVAPAAPAQKAPPRTRLNVAELIEEGFACFRQKDYAGAVRHWEQAQPADAGNKTLNYNLKLAHAKLAAERPSAFRAARSGKA